MENVKDTPPKTKKRLAVVDDHYLFRQGLISLLDEFKEFEVMMEASNGKDLLDQMKEASQKKKPLPEIILLDIQMPVMDGIDTTVRLRKRYPKTKIIILTMHDETEMIVHLIEKGANGFLPKNEDIERVVDAIYSVMEIGYYFNDRVSKALVKGLVNTEKILPTFCSANLTEQDLSIMTLICKEFTNKEIAERLQLSPRTVDGYRVSIMKKIGAKNTAGIVMYAVKNNIVV
jgi:DNA-binding NarL/FixJ family response regulator